jgi:hypothetical protein
MEETCAWGGDGVDEGKSEGVGVEERKISGQKRSSSDRRQDYKGGSVSLLRHA